MEERNSLPNANLKANHDSRHVLLALCLIPSTSPFCWCSWLHGGYLGYRQFQYQWLQVIYSGTGYY